MPEHSSTGLWLAVACIACSSPDDADLFASAETHSTTGGTDSEAAVTTTSENSSASSSSAGGASSTAMVTSNVGGATSSDGSATSAGADGAGGDGDGAGGSGGTGGVGGNPSSGGAGAVDGASATGGTGGTEPNIVTLEFEEDEDCVALTCPDTAPHLVGCDVTFSEFNREYACLAVEGQVVFFKSGENCSGSVVEAGSRIICSSARLNGGITAEECVTNKQDLHVVDDRCNCEAAEYIDGCIDD